MQTQLTDEQTVQSNLEKWRVNYLTLANLEEIWTGEPAAFPIYWYAPVGDEHEVMDYEKYAAKQHLREEAYAEKKKMVK